MINSTDRTAVLAARAIDDKASGLPNQALPCKCGAYGFEVVDDALDLVRCKACGLVQHAGELGATLRVYRESQSKGGVWQCEASTAVESAVANAKAKGEKDRTEEEKKLATLTLSGKEEENGSTPADGR